MYYRLKEGVLLLYVCDQALLIASEKADRGIPFIRHLNETAGIYCQQLKKWMSLDALYEYAMEQFDGDSNLIYMELKQFIDSLEQKGYLAKQEDMTGVL